MLSQIHQFDILYLPNVEVEVLQPQNLTTWRFVVAELLQIGFKPVRRLERRDGSGWVRLESPSGAVVLIERLVAGGLEVAVADTETRLLFGFGHARHRVGEQTAAHLLSRLSVAVTRGGPRVSR